MAEKLPTPIYKQSFWCTHASKIPIRIKNSSNFDSPIGLRAGLLGASSISQSLRDRKREFTPSIPTEIAPGPQSSIISKNIGPQEDILHSKKEKSAVVKSLETELNTSTDTEMLDNTLANMKSQFSKDITNRKSADSIRNRDSKVEQESKMLGDLATLNSMSIRFTKFKNVLDTPNVDLDQLRKLSWSGIPEEVRSITWQLLMGYLPGNSERRDATISRKRKEYEEYVTQSFGKGEKALDQQLHHQILIDVQRTHPHISLYQNPIVRESLKKILYCWAIRHPASGYVQGINDLVTPFLQVFLQSIVDIESADLSELPTDTITQLEADCFWCLTKLLDGIQDNYTFAQPGIQRQVNRLKELIARIDAPLLNHFQAQGVEFIQFAFRWMNCLLMREVSLKSTIRMWDTYMAEGQDGFSDFHLYVCAAFLVKWSEKLRKMEFADIMMFIQSLPTETQKWEEKDVELLLSEAFMWKSLFHNSPSHLIS